nr:Uncharacterised protein [Klebsiella pneumoniae]
MQQNGYIPDTANAIAQYFNKASLPSQQETLGQIVMDILNEGRHLNRKALCTKLLSRWTALARRRKRATIRP